MPSASSKVLVIGYGNPAREDDGLGPAAAEAVARLAIAGVTVETNFQLTVEDAAAVAENDCVVFLDAARTGPEPFFYYEIQAAELESVSSHAVPPEGVVWLARGLFDAGTEAYLLGIRGYSFEMFTERLTAGARANLDKALKFFVPVLQARSFRQAALRQNNDHIH